MTTSELKRRRIKLLILIPSTLFLSLLLVYFSYRNYFNPKVRQNPYPKHLVSERAFLTDTSIKPFGEDGVHIIDNLYAHSRRFFVHSPTFKNFLTQGDYNYSVEAINPKDFLNSSKKSKAKLIPGTTLILASERSMQKMQSHYFHFLEEFLLGWAAYKGTHLADLDTIIFPDTENWEGFNQINKQILTALFPKATILNKPQYEDLTKHFLVQFQHAIFVDRMACHNLPAVQTYNKMAIGHASLIKPAYLNEFKEKVLTALKTHDEVNRPQTITYINRKNRRYLTPEFRESFINELQTRFPTCKVQAVWFEKHSYKEQLQIIRNTDILIAPHGNGLTHAFFLPNHSLVFEIFPEGAFAMDYQLISELSGHQYFAIEPNLGIFSQSGQRQPPRGNVNQVIPSIDTGLIMDQIDQFLNPPSTGEKESSSLE